MDVFLLCVRVRACFQLLLFFQQSLKWNMVSLKTKLNKISRVYSSIYYGRKSIYGNVHE